MLRVENIAKNIKVKENVNSEFHTTFVVEPLFRGYGHTLGHSLRRVLLTGVPGCAIKAVKIDGIVNEFSVKEGLKENILEILLNIKSIVLKSSVSGDRTMSLSVKGPKVVTAADIKHDNSLEIINKDNLIATITSDMELNIEFLVGTGEGFVFAEEQDREEWSAGFMPIDSLYSPIKKINYSVEETIFGRMTNFDKLILDIHTNGSVNPKDILSYAVEMMEEHLKALTNIGNKMEHLREEESEVEAVAVDEAVSEMAENDSVPKVKIEDLDLSVRSFNCLKNSDITNLRQLAAMNKKDLLEIKNLGKSSLEEIVKKLSEYGINLEV